MKDGMAMMKQVILSQSLLLLCPCNGEMEELLSLIHAMWTRLGKEFTQIDIILLTRVSQMGWGVFSEQRS